MIQTYAHLDILLSFQSLSLPLLHNFNDLNYWCSRRNRLAWLPLCLCLVRASLTVPGHSGTPVIEAELREGTGGGDGGVWT